MNKFLAEITKILKKEKRLFSKDDNKLLKGELISLITKDDEKLLNLLAASKEVKKRFFKQIGKITIFQKENFLQLITMNEFLPDSFTAFEVNIGLTDNKKFISSQDNVSLVFPHKDCILEGGQEKEDVKRNEIFYNTVLAPDEIDRLREPKVLTNTKKFDKKGEHKIDNISKSDNLVIKGNNLLALYSLLSNYRNKIKLIYIDPPYNTGNDSFKYNDSFNHSSWLTFIKNRLEIARELLSNEGIIFVQCDDNEQAYLKVLMDEIFGRENFVANMVWKGRGGRQDSKFIAQIHETIVLFAKNINYLNINKNVIEDKSIYSFYDDKKKQNYKLQLVRKWGSNSKRADRPNLYYGIKFDGKIIFPIHPDGSDGCWRWSKKKLEEAIKNDLIVKQEKNGKIELYEKVFEMSGEKEIVYSSWIENSFSGRGANHIQQLFGERLFDYPKPEELLKYILSISTKENDIVLDFFAGSGTTGAVAHKMNRQYILIEQMDYIHKLPEARLKKVIKGEQGGISKEENWKGGGSFVYTELLEWNSKYVRELENAKTKLAIKKIKAKIEKEQFYKYQIETDKFDNKEFEKLSEKEQKEVLIDMLDMNHLYVNIDSINDATFAVSKEDKELNKKFYNQK